MHGSTIIILEDNEERISQFQLVVSTLGAEFHLRLWRDAPTMIAECHPYLAKACLISLDHDLHPASGVTADPGTGLDVAEFLGCREPVCPVIVHTSNNECRWSMYNALRFGKWQVEIVSPIGEAWIQSSWLPRARMLIRA